MKNDVESAKWCRLAAEQGLKEAQRKLGKMYSKGEGVPEDDVEAAKWYRLAAEQGLPQAQLDIGLRLGVGQGVPKNTIEAYKWLNLAASQGNELAEQARELVAQEMSPEQIAEAQQLSTNWKPTARK